MSTAVEIDYTNWRGERGLKRIIPRLLWWGETEFHPDPQWLLKAYDLTKEVWRDYAMKDIHSWTPIVVHELEITAEDIKGNLGE